MILTLDSEQALSVTPPWWACLFWLYEDREIRIVLAIVSRVAAWLAGGCEVLLELVLHGILLSAHVESKPLIWLRALYSFNKMGEAIIG